MTEEFFFAKSHMGPPLDSIFFKQDFFFSGTVSGPGGYPNQNLHRYDERPSYMILLKQGNLCESKLIWAYNGLKFIFERFFRFCEKITRHIKLIVWASAKWKSVRFFRIYQSAKRISIFLCE